MLVKKLKSHNDNVYFNGVIDAPDGKLAIPAAYTETLTAPMLANPSEFYCSMLRFSIGLENVPIMKFPLDVNQPDPNTSTCAIGIKTAANNYFTQRVIYVPNQFGAGIVPPMPSGGMFTNAQAVSAYYGIFSVNAFIQQINTALRLACTAAFGNLFTAFPVYVFVPETELIKLIILPDFFTTGAQIYINNYLINYLSSFQFIYNASPVLVSQFQDDFYHVTNYSPWDRVLPAGPYIFSEEYKCMTLWFDIAKIIVTTSLPVNSEYSSAQDPNAFGTQTGNTTQQSILTDFVLDFSSIADAQVIANYLPTSQYRLVDMASNTSLTTISLQFYYLDKYGNQFPMEVPANKQASFKLGFFKKYLYANEW